MPGVGVHRTTGATRPFWPAWVPQPTWTLAKFELLPGVLHVHRISSPYKLAGRAFRPEGTVVEFANGVKVGGEQRRRDGRAVLDRNPRADVRDRSAREGRGRQLSARRRLQAAQFALRLSGDGHSGPRADARGRRCARPAGGERGDGDLADRADAALRRSASRWARATCRTSTCCASWARCASRCC